MRKITTPFLLVNPKSYLFGQESLDLALASDQAAQTYQMQIFFTCCYSDIRLIKENTKKVIVTAQHMDAIYPGRGEGYVLPEALADAGCEAVYLNHAEHPLTLDVLYQSIQRAKEVGLISIVCANSASEGVAIATMMPDIIICEPTDLIGTGEKADNHYMSEVVNRIRAVNKEIKIVVGASIQSGKDCVKVLEAGADGTGATSGIVNADSPSEKVNEMAKMMSSWKMVVTKNNTKKNRRLSEEGN